MKAHCSSLIVISLLILTSCQRNQESFPVLLLAGEQDFGLYTGEILEAEGFNGYALKSVFDESITLAVLKHYDVVVLAQHGIGALKCEMLKKYVSEGGTLIAFRPDTGLYDLFGISGIEGHLSDGYVAIDTTHITGKGLTNQPIQSHGLSDQYALKTGVMLAELYTEAVEKTSYPALVSNIFGSGVAYAFSYNLSETVVLTRQGNPLSAGREMDGIHGLRAMDLFANNWIDTSRNTINQADIHMNLLSHCVENTSAGKPLPRLWYFPDNLRCLVTLTNDGEYRTESDFEVQLADVDSLGARMTLYVLETNKVSREWSDRWSARGFEISGHPDDTPEAGDPQWFNMHNALYNKKKEISDLYGNEMKTVVNHWFVWCGKDSAGNPEFAAQAMIEASQGLGMDINYAHYDNGSTEGHFLGSPGYYQGNYNGSGLVIKFTDSKGRILNLYQHLNNVYDQQYMELKDPKGFFQCFKGLMDRSLDNEVYSFISIKSHNDEYSFSKLPLKKMISYAAEQGVPIWTAANLLDFLKARDDAYFNEVRLKGNKLSFNLNSSLAHEAGLTFIIPARFETTGINRVLIDNKSYPFEIRPFKGKEYAFVTVKPGHSCTVEVVYSN